jgi:hypothetical protein
MRALIKGDDTATSLAPDEPDVDAAEAVLTATFELAVVRHFKPGDDVRVIGEFVRDVRESYSADVFRQIDAEALIRAALGEDVSTDGIDMRSEFHTKVFTIVEVVERHGLSERAVDAMVVEAERVAIARGFALTPRADR